MGNDHVDERHGLTSPGTAFRAAIARVGASAAAVVATAAMLLCIIPANAVETQAAGTWSSLSDVEKQSSYGYFVWKSENAGTQDEKDAASKAANVLKGIYTSDLTRWGNSSNESALIGYTRLGENGDATSLTNMRQAIVDIQQINDFRSSLTDEPCRTDMKPTFDVCGSDTNHTLTPYRVTDVMMAMAQLNANWMAGQTTINTAHAQVFSVSENGSWNGTALGTGAAKQWYREKDQFDQGISDSRIGHYANLTNKDWGSSGSSIKLKEYLWSGLGVVTREESGTMSGTYGPTITQDYAADSGAWGPQLGPDFSVDAYLADFESYIGQLKPKKTIVSVRAPQLTVASSTMKPTSQLPKTVDVTYSDGTTGTAMVMWDAIPGDWNTEDKQHEVTVHGAIEGFSAGVDMTLTVLQSTVVSARASDGGVDPNVQTNVGVAPNLRFLAVQAEWSNGFTRMDSRYQLEWNQSDLEASRFSTPGDKVTVHGTAKIPQPNNANMYWVFDVSVDVTVIVKQVSTVEGPSGIYTTVESGTKPDLSGAKATVTYVDGTTSQADVDWGEPKPADYTSRNGGDFRVSGTVTVKTAGGSGNASMTTTVQLTYRVNPATITSANTGVNTITTQAGVDPTPQLPKTAKVTWSNGDIENLSIAWNTISKDDYAHAGTFQASGTVSWNGTTHPVTQSITVTAPPAPTVTGVKPTKTAVTTIAGHMPALDQVKATVTYSDGSTRQDVDVNWDEVPADKYAAAGEFDVNGVVTIDGKDWPVSVHVTVDARRIAKVMPSEDAITVDPVKDTDPVPALIGKATVTWSDGATESRSIPLNLPAGWNHPRTAHTVIATGRVDGWDAAVEFPVQVNAATIESVVHVLPTMTTTVGVQPVLPQTTKATWSNGETSDEPIIWDSNTVPPDVSKPGIVTVEGSVAIERRFGVWFTLNVKEEGATEVPVTGVTVSGPSTLIVGETSMMTATVTPENATNKTVTWRSSNTSVVTIDPNYGTVNARGEGKSIITATALDGSGVIGAWEITVNAKVVPDTTAPTFAGVGNVTVDFGASFDPLAGVKASDDRDGDLTAAVKVSGSVDVNKAGSYTLTYTVSDRAGNVATAKRTVTVRPQPVPECTPTKFTDLAGASHVEDIEWLSGQCVTQGYPNGDGTVSFGGMRTVVRQDMAAFLYRMAGSPAIDVDAELAKHPFTDVDEHTPHVDAILWLAKARISTGYDNGDGTRSFGGMRTVVRQDMAAFLHRYAQWKGVADPSGQAVAFTDVDEHTSHREDIDWLSKTGVTTGYDNGNGTRSFGGMRDVVRQDMAAFLHRMATNVLK